MSDSTGGERFLLLPPYLWVWLVLFAVALPRYLGVLAILLADLFSPEQLLGEGALAWGFILRLTSAIELFPLLIVIAGVLSLALPSFRRSYLEKKFGLKDTGSFAPAGEINSFIRTHAPGIEVSGNLLRGDQVAFTYPTGFRGTGIALLGGVVKLWRGDNESARGVLFHEMAHARNGDTLIAGAGSGFRALLNYWPAVFVAAVIVPSILVWFATSYEFFTAQAGLTPSGDLVTYKLEQLLLFNLPSLLFMLATALMWTASVIFLPLMALWYAELAADCTAAACMGTPVPLTRALRLPSAPVSRWSRILARMTHPPDRIRLVMLEHIRSPFIRMLLLIMLFPAAMVVSMLFSVLYYVIFNLSVTWATGMPASFADGILSAEAGATAPLILITGLFILIWPFIAKARGGLYGDGSDSDIRDWRRAHRAGGILTVVMALLLLAAGSL